MSPHRRVRPLAFAFARLGAILLALALLALGQPIQAARLSQTYRAMPPRRPARPANGPPVAHDDLMAAFTNQTFQELYVLDNDTDPDGDTLTITDVGFASHGQAAPGFYTIYYQPDPNFTGSDVFTYTITDGHNHFSTAQVTVNVADSGTATTRFAVYAGSLDSSIWTVSPHGGTSGSNASNGACDGSSGLSIEDVDLQLGQSEFFNAFDNGLTLWVDNVQVTPALPMTVNHHSLTSGPVSLSGLRVYMTYTGLRGSDTLRTLAQFVNVTGSSIAITATLATNVGSDANTIVIGSSTGITNPLSTADRWLVTSDSPTNPGFIVNTHVLYGPGSPLVTPDFVGSTVFSCSYQNIPATQGVRARFHVTVPANTTRSLLFFNQAHNDNQVALADAAVFNSTPVGLLDGLSSADLANIVNWKLGPISRVFLPGLWR